MSFFAELKRRNVVRVGLAYAVIGWLLAQVAEFAFENFGAPEWVLKTFVVVLLLGLPIALIFAWAFEMTPEGLKREKDVDRSASITTQTGRKLDRLIIGVLCVIVVVLVAERFVPGDDSNSETVAESEQSIAVLPFVDLSASQADEYFGKGIAEELLNALAQYPGLRVAARTSAFSFAGEDLDLRQVGDALDVAHVLEGSIRRSGDRLRITAQLIRAADGFHLWSETYERGLTDIFEIQDDIVRELTLVLQIRLGVGAGSGRARQHDIDPQAYETYLHGLYLWANRHADDNRVRAIESLQLATDIDPEFADAWAAFALSLIHSDASTIAVSTRKKETVFNALTRALELDPDTARAHSGLALYYGTMNPDIEKSLYHADRATELAPNAASVRYARASAAIARGDYETAASEMRWTRRLDPLNRVIARVEAQHNLIMGRIGEAGTFFKRCAIEYCEGETYGQINLVEYEWYSGQSDAALARLAALLAAVEENPPQDLLLGDAYFNALRYFYDVFAGQDESPTIPELIGRSAPSQSFALVALAHQGEFEKAVEVIHQSQETNGAFAYGFGLMPLAKGGFEFPKDFRKYPGYRDFWAQPGMRELAAARIANGHPEGLPLNDDGTLVQY
jgi:TolB-like protein